MFKGFKIVLTGDESLVSNYHSTSLSFASALPMDVFPVILSELLFPTRSDKHGRMYSSQYGLCKIESSLIESGFSRRDIAIVDPRKLDKGIGPDTRVVGISVLDPLGLNYGTMLLRVVLELMGIETKLQSYMSWATMKLLKHSVILKYRERIRVIVGGQGVWEIIDTGLQQALGIDTVVESEGELVAPELFRRALHDEKLPSYVKGEPVPVEKIPVIKTPSNGLVEISRGCGRGCKFCNPTLLMYRIIPLENIVREVYVNVQGGFNRIVLHSEDFLRYGSLDLTPRRDRVIELIDKVIKTPGVENISFDFTTPSTVMSNPRLVREVSELLGLSSRNPSIIEIGIETTSPRLIKLIAPGKPKPFKPEEWSKVVEDAVVTLNDSGWWVCATIIIGLPSETSEDIKYNFEIIEKLEPYNVFIYPLPFIPSGSLRKTKKLYTQDLLPNSTDNLLLIGIAVYDAVKKLNKLSKHIIKNAPLFIKQILGAILYFATVFGLKKLQRGLNELSEKYLKTISNNKLFLKQ